LQLYQFRFNIQGIKKTGTLATKTPRHEEHQNAKENIVILSNKCFIMLNLIMKLSCIIKYPSNEKRDQRIIFRCI
jgi:hypothetical protein